MKEHAAEAAPATASDCPEFDWSAVDDVALVRGMVAKDNFAWLEFLRRFDTLFTIHISCEFRRRMRMMPTADFLSEVKEDIHDLLSEGKMRPLRAFDSRRGTLASWAGRVAEQLTIRRLHLLSTLPGDDEAIVA